MKRLLANVALICFFVSFGVQAATETAKNYQMGAGDTIRITVFGEEDLSLETTLGENGTVSYPYLGLLQATGVSVADFEKEIADGLRGDYLINPSVHVDIIEYRAFYIYGEVKSPGGYPYQPNLTVERAVALAGGFTQRASKEKFELSRKVDGVGQKSTVKLEDEVKPGDSIFVKDSFF
ncbi:polysaccharide biosynthesis/export family protein [Corallincola platygyrae]|uniref:Polysaccharide biosynthesis/export family protein n=1 Tax=Corallincola platygyrae TaxID=1193278 RepID=A0ABW4XMK7_9GAMM